ncbi:hypothetical protein ANRL4_04959 [Anaerolineae bacterium]|nr:hypothetical protein ANRL4_04959 [Anaerolineae bacterium]
MANIKTKPKTSETSPEILMLGYLCIKGADNLIEKVNILDRFGLSDEDIAIICGSAVQSVRNARQQSKNKPVEQTIRR